MSPRAVDKRARPGNEHQVVRPAAPESPNAVTALQTNRISQQKQQAKAS
ncbi:MULTISPECIES: hypothetical protein [Kribbella]|jgi:hypothetical protein|uniref:Uncharacterized protein n=1 Tax=Kribbella pratensis TaxID=2512112 RepID=A0ABY2FFJ2_9ACTN|nr:MULTISPECIES: hypothetical protein [Kribbella]TDO67307.1 hypothetical protein EV651_103217 [Kribbella sp. VKM Ac-2571]TDW89711.1 hypothetical protein EV137_3509 [Kribbella pratensis]TDX08773.1 hypothetical protein EV647_0113 [Kribbella sp. VKM Ac-2566]